jgi:glyoxylase-like metal-dependent hydrolase (beta-lactamase superfamily II)
MHPEHALGAHAFPPNTKLYRSRDLQADIDARDQATVRQYSSFAPSMAELLRGAEFRKADVLFDKEQTLDLGGVRVRMMAMGPSHTPGDAVFWIEPDAILVSGGVATTTLPVFAGFSSVSTWLQSLDRLEQLQPKRIVPGHGPLGDATMLATSKTFLTTIRARATELKKQGKTVDDTVRTIQDELKDRYAPNQIVNAVRTAYREAP